MYLAQCGEKPPSAKPLKGFKGTGVLEVVEDFAGDTYRAVYTVKLAGVIYILHAFQKKSKQGIATPKQDVELIETRLKRAKEHHSENYKSRKREEKMTQEIGVKASSGNVFADLGLENSDELLVKAELARKISSIITKQQMTQVEAAELLGVDQPKVSALLNGKLSGFSVVRLFRFLNALGRDVEIVVKTKPKSRSQAQTRVTA